MKMAVSSKSRKSGKEKEAGSKSEDQDGKDEDYDGDQSNNQFLTLDYLEKRGKDDDEEDPELSEDFSEDEFEPA